MPTEIEELAEELAEFAPSPDAPETFTCAAGCGAVVAEEFDGCDASYWCEGCEAVHHDTAVPAGLSRCRSCSRRGIDRCANTCDDAEGCFRCGVCGERHAYVTHSRCDTCGHCVEEHSCRWCEGCEEYHSQRVDVCSDCDRCVCNCEDEEENNMLPYMRRHPIKFWGGKPSKFLPSGRHVSAEIEIAKGGAAANDVIDRWMITVKPDGSVNDGCELNTAPAVGDTFIQQVNDLCAAMAGGDAPAEVDQRCGLHLHVDVGDYSYAAYLRLFWVWACVETGVYSTLPRSRQNNSYCAKRASQLRDSIGQARKLSHVDTVACVVAAIRERQDTVGSRYNYGSTKEYVKAKTREVRQHAKGVPFIFDHVAKNCRFKKLRGKDVLPYPYSPGGGRYYGLNLQSAFTHGTVEFRCHAGTAEAEKINYWAVLCTAIVDYAKRASLADVQALEYLSSWDALMRILPHDDARAYFTGRRVKFLREY